MSSTARFLGTAELKALTGIHERTIQRRLKGITPTSSEPTNTGKPRHLYAFDALPASIKAKLPPPTLNPVGAELLGLEQQGAYSKASERKRNEANRRLQIVKTYRHYCALGLTKSQAQRRVREELNIAERTTRKLLGLVTDSMSDGQMLDALLPQQHNPAPRTADVHPELLRCFDSLCINNQSAPSISLCIRKTRQEAKRQQWGRVPSASYFRRRVVELKRKYPDVFILGRQGERALERALPSQRRDKSMLSALSWVNADGHELDIFIEWPARHWSEEPYTGRGTLLVLQDVYSGYPVAWRLDRTENHYSATLMLAGAIREFGVFDKISFDNGHAFASKTMTGGASSRFRFKQSASELNGWLTNLGIEIQFVKPAHGQSKPVERLNRQIAEAMKGPEFIGAYTGRSTQHKPENYGARAIPYADVVKYLDAIMQDIRDTPSKAAMCRGRSPSTTFFASLNERNERGEIRQLTEAQLRWVTKPVEEVKVRKDSTVRLKGNRYSHESFIGIRGHKVHVRYDPDNLHAGVWVFEHGKQQPLCHATCIDDSGYGDTEAARRSAREKRAQLNAAKVKLKEMRLMSDRERTELTTAQAAPAAAPKRVRAKVQPVDFSPSNRQPTTPSFSEAELADMKALLLRGGRRTG